MTVICNKKKPSRNLFAQAWIERVSLPASNKFFESTNDPSFCETKYAQEGIWYDALACNYTKLIQNQNNTGHLQEFRSLLEEIDLSNLAQRKSKPNLHQ